LETKDLVEVAAFEDEMLARACAEMLTEAGVECHVERIDPLGLTPLLGFTPGIRLRVRHEDEQQARELVASIRQEDTANGTNEAPNACARPVEDAKSPEVETALLRLRTRRRFLWVLYASFLPITFLFLLVDRSGKAAFSVAAISVVLLILAGYWVASSRCPRCWELCYRRRWVMGWATNILLHHCMHCGLDLRATKMN
jgi:hypothetical protein